MSKDFTVAKAVSIAVASHMGQVDKGTGRPYITHPMHVGELLVSFGPEYVMAGILHDVVEDSDMTLDKLASLGCPAVVLDAIDAVTKREGESYDDLVGRARNNPMGRLVKIADNIHNSDESRLALLDTATAERLREKYARARVILFDDELYSDRGEALAQFGRMILEHAKTQQPFRLAAYVS